MANVLNGVNLILCRVVPDWASALLEAPIRLTSATTPVSSSQKSFQEAQLSETDDYCKAYDSYSLHFGRMSVAFFIYLFLVLGSSLRQISR